MNMGRFAKQKGVALIGAVATLLILSLMAVTVVSLVGTQTYAPLHQAQGLQAYWLAEGGAHRALTYLSKEGGACTDITDSSSFTAVTLGQGTFTVAAVLYHPTPTTLSAAIGDTATTIPVDSTAGYAPHGRITIGSEQIDYTAVTGTSFTGARRGANNTTAASHSSATQVNQDQCTITSTGTIPAAFGDARRVSEVIVTGGQPVKVVTNVPVGFFDNTQHLTHYDGTYSYLFYEKNDANIYWKYSSDGVTWSSGNTLAPSGREADIGWDIWWEDDATGVLMVGDDTANTVTFHKIVIAAGPTITLTGAETAPAFDFPGSQDLVVTMAGNTVFAQSHRTGSQRLYARNAPGFPDGTGTYEIRDWGGQPTDDDNFQVISYSTAKVLAVRATEPGAPNDGWESATWVGCSTCIPADETTVFTNTNSIKDERGVAGVRISDTDFRMIIASDATTIGKLTEWQWDDSSWTGTVIDATNTTYQQPAMMRDAVNGDLYVFAQTSGEANSPIYRYKNTGGSSWGTRVAADDAESTARSIPVTQYSEPPPASSRTIPCKLVWAYRVANGSNFDLKVGTLSLSFGPSCGLSIIGWREVY